MAALMDVFRGILISQWSFHDFLTSMLDRRDEKLREKLQRVFKQKIPFLSIRLVMTRMDLKKKKKLRKKICTAVFLSFLFLISCLLSIVVGKSWIFFSFFVVWFPFNEIGDGGSWDPKRGWGSAKLGTAGKDFAICCTVACSSKPCFQSWLPWWPHLLKIPWEW